MKSPGRLYLQICILHLQGFLGVFFFNLTTVRQFVIHTLEFYLGQKGKVGLIYDDMVGGNLHVIQPGGKLCPLFILLNVV